MSRKIKQYDKAITYLDDSQIIIKRLEEKKLLNTYMSSNNMIQAFIRLSISLASCIQKVNLTSSIVL